jgi:hypothetical protein
MGSWDVACTVSRLPIGCGDAVRYFLVQEDSTRGWRMRSIPIKGTYADYGGVAPDNEEDKTILSSWVDCFNVDGIENGSARRNMAAWKGMPAADFIEAVSQDQPVRVKGFSQYLRDKYNTKKEPRRFAVPDDYLGMNLIWKELNSIGFTRADFAVEEDAYRSVTIRYIKGYDRAEMLTAYKKVEELLAPKYSTMTYEEANGHAMLVRPKLTETYTTSGTSKKYPESTCRILLAIIREDVWQILLSQKPSEREYYVEKYHQEYTTKQTANVCKAAEYIAQKNWDELLFLDEELRGTTLFSNACALLERGVVVDRTAALMTEAMTIEHRLWSLNRSVEPMPTYHNGPQCTDWRPFVQFQQDLNRLTKQCRKEERERMGD